MKLLSFLFKNKKATNKESNVNVFDALCISLYGRPYNELNDEEKKTAEMAYTNG